MKLFNADQMRRLDAEAIERIGIPGVVLMENASRGVYEIMAANESPLTGKKIVIACGRGNNGGDGFAVARHLHNAGADPIVFLAADPKTVSGDALTNLNICKKLKIPVTAVAEKKLQPLRAALKKADLVVDALLGTGAKGALKPLYDDIIKLINGRGKTVYAVDAPSGVIVDTGEVTGNAVRAHHTVTFGAPKIGLFVYPGAEYAGKIYIVDIGIPTALTQKAKTDTFLTTRNFVRLHMRPRRADAHKGDCGRLLIIGGSRGMSGAVCLAAMAALRCGAGLVYAAVPECIADIVDKKITECVTLPMPDVDGALSELCLDEIEEKLASVDAIILGPGMDDTDATHRVVAGVLSAARAPVLVDADGLNALAAIRTASVLKKVKAPLILTPHPGEMARLAGVSAADVQAHRLDTARGVAKKLRAIVVLKGAHSLVAAPDGVVYVNPTGNAGMATAGSGDVLSGITGALLAGRAHPYAAAVCGAFLHGMAGDAAAALAGQRSVTAGDMARAIVDAVKHFDS